MITIHENVSALSITGKTITTVMIRHVIKLQFMMSDSGDHLCFFFVH